MKKRGVLLLAAAIGLMLAACGNLQDAAQKESQEKENLPASQEYASSDGAYKVILLEGLTQTDTQLQPGFTMMELSGGSAWKGFSGISVRNSKSSIPGASDDIESLTDYADYITDLALDGSGMTVSWEDTDAPSSEGAVQCLAREGAAKVGTSKGLAYGYYVESADSYFAVFMVGNNGDVKKAKQVIALEISEEAVKQGGTKDFINGMTAVLDSENGASIREIFKALEDSGADKSQLETLTSQARQSLSASWGIESAADLTQMADWLMNEGHNQDALQFLDAYDGINETDRDAFDAGLKAQNTDAKTYISLMAAYDAQAAYGDNAIAAWDLSRVGTIMGFGYAAGYCTYEEAMDKTLEAAGKAQEAFDSWEDFNKSYLYGYSYWSEESLDDPGSSAAERAELVSGMESQANGPFSMGWDIELKKEW